MQNPVIYPQRYQPIHCDRLNLQDTNMVQEVHGGYDAYSAMMRHNPSYGNMHNLGGYNAAFSGTGQPQPPMGQYGAPDYYHGGNGNLQAAGDAASWSSVMYPSTSVSPPTSSSRHTNLLDHEWPQTQYVGNVTVQPHETTSHMGHHLGHAGTGSATPTGSGNGGNSSYSSYRGSGCLPTMPSEYGPTSSSGGHTSGMTPTMTPSPTPGAMVMGGSPPGGSGGNANRQTNRPPYDWMKKVAYPSTPTTGKTRTKDKYRVVYTDHQRLELEKEFHYSRYITIRRKAELAQNLALSERQVKIWFQNRRAKERKQNKKRDEAMGIKTERPDSLPLMSPLGGVCDGGVQQQHQVHCGGTQGQQMTLGGAMGVAPVVGGGATPDMSGLHGTVGGPHPCHTPPMSTHSPPMSTHHS